MRSVGSRQLCYRKSEAAASSSCLHHQLPSFPTLSSFSTLSLHQPGGLLCDHTLDLCVVTREERSMSVCVRKWWQERRRQGQSSFMRVSPGPTEPAVCVIWGMSLELDHLQRNRKGWACFLPLLSWDKLISYKVRESECCEQHQEVESPESQSLVLWRPCLVRMMTGNML